MSEKLKAFFSKLKKTSNKSATVYAKITNSIHCMAICTCGHSGNVTILGSFLIKCTVCGKKYGISQYMNVVPVAKDVDQALVETGRDDWRSF